MNAVVSRLVNRSFRPMQACKSCLQIITIPQEKTVFFCTFARSILSAYAVCVTFASISLERIFRMFRRNSVEAIVTEIRSATGSA